MSRGGEGSKASRQLRIAPKIMTLVPLDLAKRGYTFEFLGLPPSCRRCGLSFLCSKLRKGMRYRVIEVRRVVHRCPLHERVVPAVVIPLPIKMFVPAEAAVEGVALKYPIIRCSRLECENFNLCNPPALMPGDRLRVLKILDQSIYCSGRLLRLVEVILENP